MYILLMMLPKDWDKSFNAYLPKYQINSSNYSTLPQDNIYVCTKGQLNSELKYDFIVSPKMPTTKIIRISAQEVY